ncbi:MAG: hypothetical protein MIO93_12455, partial [ANME-2 cluster archaeon]|nr:hypothetical protein [ANME-2 cluster archaeon]
TNRNETIQKHGNNRLIHLKSGLVHVQLIRKFPVVFLRQVIDPGTAFSCRMMFVREPPEA